MQLKGMNCVLWTAGVFALLSPVHCGETLEQLIQSESDFSQFYGLLEINPIANSTFAYKPLTVFVPTNRAFQGYTGRTDATYHMSSAPISLEGLSSIHELSTEMLGNPPLWISKRSGKHSTDIFVNNARILKDRSNIERFNSHNQQQILHVIDDVLIPVLASKASPFSIYNPDAWGFMNNSENLDIGAFRVRLYRQRVRSVRKEEVFKAGSGSTFLIPVDDGFKASPRPEKIDGKVIDGHIIPNKVLFTQATENDYPFETLAFGDNIKITVSFHTKFVDGKAVQTIVKSNTLMGDSNLPKGVVMAEIVKANIPVKNGVVHLIKRPLVVVDTNVTVFLKVQGSCAKRCIVAGPSVPQSEQEDGPLSQFHSILQDVGQDFINSLNDMQDLTLFAPSNEAWNETAHLHDTDRLKQILNLHLVGERLPIDVIRQKNVNSLYQAATFLPGKTLYFNLARRGPGQEEILTVEGGGVNATVIQSNIAVTNGIVHIIDKVLGVPYNTLLDKLRTDPMLNDTYVLGKAERFNDQLIDRTKQFTYFVPRDKAWRWLEINFPSVHKKLFMKDFAYHARQVLERHLVVADVPYTIEEMKLKAVNGYVTLPAVRGGSLRLKIKDNGKNAENNYQIEWRNQWIDVFRADVQCTNGIIHVIDRPFIEDSDIRVTGVATPSALVSPLVISMMVIASMFK